MSKCIKKVGYKVRRQFYKSVVVPYSWGGKKLSVKAR